MKSYAREDEWVESPGGMVFSPECSRTVKLLAQIEYASFVSMNWYPSVNPSAGLHLEIHIQIAVPSEQGLPTFVPPPFFAFFGCLSVSLCGNEHFTPNLQPCLLICNFDTREGAMNHAMDLCNFPRGHLCTVSGALVRMDCSLWAACLSMKFSHRCSSAILEWERKNGLHVYCDRGESCKHLPLYTSLLLSTDSNLPCVLSTLTDFSVLLLSPVFLSWFFRFWPRN